MIKMKILKFQEKANALSLSKIKYGHKLGLKIVLISFTGRPVMTGVFSAPSASFFTGIPSSYCESTPGLPIIHSSIRMNRGSPAITDSDFCAPKNISQFEILDEWIFKMLIRKYRDNKV